jgi:succinate dehydrogenase/fumarate reductase flavoprotein subunit
MAHPTCAPARLPIVPLATESPLQQAVAELGVLRETYHAIVRVNDLLQHAPHSLREKCRIDPLHMSALVDLLNAVPDHRFQAVKATLESMHSDRNV